MVNAWTQWGKLKTVVVGIADSACFPPEEPGFRGKINNPALEKEINWPIGPKKQSSIDACNGAEHCRSDRFGCSSWCDDTFFILEFKACEYPEIIIFPTL